MKAVGVKVLQAKLSEFLRLVKAGESVLITERDEVIAEMRPARRQNVGELSLAEKLAALADRGDVTLASRPMRRDWTEFLNAIPPVDGVDVQALLDDLRGDSSG